MKLLKFTAALAVGLVLFISCRKPTSANWDVDVVVPVVNSRLNIKNFISDTLFTTDNQGLLYLTLNRNIADLKIDSLVNIPNTLDTVFLKNPSPFPTVLQPGQALNFFTPSELEFKIDSGIALKRADVKSCLLKAKISNSVGQPLDLTYQIPSATKNGSVFTINETIPGKTGNVDGVLERTYDLSGYSLNLTGLMGNTFNTLSQTYSMAVNPGASTVNIVYGDGLTIELSYTKLIPDYFEGYFGQRTIVVKQDTARFDIGQTFKASNFMLSDATMDFKIVNDFGAEFTANLSNVKSVNSYDNKVVPLSTNLLSNININRATRVNRAVSSSTLNLSFNKNNSNITTFISNLPNKLSYQGYVKLNPLQNISSYNDFAFYNTGIHVLANISIPLRFRADYFLLTTTSATDFSNTKQLDNVRGGNFVILANNGYPFDAHLQAYMYDENNVIIDSLFVPGANTLQHGQLDAQNMVTSSSKSKILVPVTLNKIANLKKCKSLKIYTYFIVPNGSVTELKENYEFDVNIVAELSYNVGTGG